MRFLLKPPSPVISARSCAPSKAFAAPPATSVEGCASGRAWGQQCSPDCGYVLRIEADLWQCPSKASPIVVRASYCAKRVMTTVRKGRLTPLTTLDKARRPILTSCACPTLHHLARRAVERLPGRTLDQLRNEMSERSSAALRYTVLREGVPPAMASAGPTKPGSAAEPSTQDGAQEMDSTEGPGQCYDLVEGALLCLLHERQPAPRRDDRASAYSPTLGGYFKMYSPSGRDGHDANKVQRDASEDAAERCSAPSPFSTMWSPGGECRRESCVWPPPPSDPPLPLWQERPVRRPRRERRNADGLRAKGLD